MNSRGLICILFICTLCNFQSFSQSGQGPYELSWKVDLPIVLTGIAFETYGLILAGNVEAPTLEELAALDPMSVNPFDRAAINQYSINAAEVSDWMFNLSFVVPFALAADKKVRKDYAIVGMMFLETLLLNGAASQTLTGLTQRFRPRAYNPEVPIEENTSTNAKFSFYSGHTAVFASMTFFAAKVYADYNPESKLRPYFWASAATLSGVVAILRYEAGKHFPTDIIFGYALGASLGILVPHFHKKKPRRGKESGLSFLVGPTMGQLKYTF